MAAKVDLERDMFRPPLAYGMRSLDRPFFQKRVSLKAARVFDNKNISKVRTRLENSKDALRQDRLANVYSDPDPEFARLGKKCVVLRPEFNVPKPYSTGVGGHTPNGTDASPWPHSQVLSELISQELIAVIPYELHLQYDYWTYHDIITAILPPSAHEEIPSGFSQVGHLLHLNLRSEYLQYKNLIAQILLDKNPGVRTVINKTADVGDSDPFRTFPYEVLAGPDETTVTVSEANCTFTFDYAKVYYNPRLSTEHARLVALFKEGEAVCDVMAGIGPFAVPAGKKRCFVWANDLNPESFAALEEALRRNGVGKFVKGFCVDGRDFIRSAAAELFNSYTTVDMKAKVPRRSQKETPDTNAIEAAKSQISKTLTQPKTFQHYVLNLPASALTFLPAFIGLYPPQLRSRLPTDTKMPMIHVYCFAEKDELNAKVSTNDQPGSPPQNEVSDVAQNGEMAEAIHSAADSIVAEISTHLRFPMHPASEHSSEVGQGAGHEEGAVRIHDVRDVAPKKRMFCASFRLPEEVAFRAPVTEHEHDEAFATTIRPDG